MHDMMSRAACSLEHLDRVFVDICSAEELQNGDSKWRYIYIYHRRRLPMARQNKAGSNTTMPITLIGPLLPPPLPTPPISSTWAQRGAGCLHAREM